LWVATGGGLCRLGTRPSPSAPERDHYPPATRWITRLLEPRSWSAAKPWIWCGTDNGLYRFNPGDGKFERVLLDPPEADTRGTVFDLYEDAEGTLWVGTDRGLYRYRDGATTVRYTVQNGLPADEVTSVRQDRTGAFWVATWRGAARLGRSGADFVLTRNKGLAADYLYSILPLETGDFWLGGTGGITVIDSAGTIRRKITGADGLVVDDVEALARDSHGNIWVGTDGAGAAKIAQSGFTTFSRKDGIEGHPSAIFESRAGEQVMITKTEQRLRVYVRQGERYRLTKSLTSRKNYGWGNGQIAFQEAEGEWWLTTSAGLYRFASSKSAVDIEDLEPVMVKVGAPDAPAPLKLFQDSRGDVWLAFRTSEPRALARWVRRTGAVECIAPQTRAVSSFSFPFVFAEDKAGQVWIGYFQGRLMRFRDGHLQEIVLPERAAGGIRSLLVDSKGRLWVGTSEAGLLRFDDPTAERPALTGFPGQETLAGDFVQCLAEDAFGRIYARTGRGVEVLDPSSSRLRHYTAEDGLIKGDLQMAFRDRDGALWFGSSQGVSRLIPTADLPAVGPYVQISRLDVAGVPQRISPLGQNRIAGLIMPFGAAPLHIEVTGVTFRPGDVLRYQTKLENADRDWSYPSSDRATSYVALQPGSYRFLARAVDADGLTSPTPAEVKFTVLAPFWRQWWFVSLVALALISGAFSTHRMRIARVVEIERVRNRIATDLHDDIGATLSQISVLSEVAKRESVAAAQDPVGRISELSRQVLESMSDIVWAINPTRDRSADLIQRMRHFAAELFTAAEVELDFTISSADDQHTLHPELRRELLLMFKEAANNVVKHARASRVTVRVCCGRGKFQFEVADNGNGFEVHALSGEGNGLPGIKRRAHALDGTATIISQPGSGTTVQIEVPIRRRARPA
jgi:signal transduction histidine kinase/ligand-binding sensor domain-containing protein